MKKLIAAVLSAALAILLCACGGQTEPVSNITGETKGKPTTSEGTAATVADIAFSLAGTGAFYEQLSADIQEECAALGLKALIMTADSSEKQHQDIESIVSAGAKVIVIEPVDVDSLQAALAVCETSGAKVIDIIDTINGHYSTLISPDYIKVGSSVGQSAVELLGETGGKCMMIKTRYDSFIMQLMSDGFNTAINADENISLIAEEYCGDDENKAYEAVKAQLSGEGTDFIFAQSSALGRGAMRAAQEAGKDVKIAVYGGDMDIIQAVADGNLYAAIFYGPGVLAHDSVSYADSIIKDSTYALPQYCEIGCILVKQEDAQAYYKEGALYAEAQ